MALLGGLLFGVSACGASELLPTTSPHSEAVRETLFERLTSARWCNRNYVKISRGLPDTSKSYAFRADGSYEWSHVSDYPEADGAGNWNFTPRDEDGGVIYLDSGDAWHFVFPGDGSIVLTSALLDPCEPITSEGKSEDLPMVEPSALFKTITANEWFRTSDLNPDTKPSSITYLTNGQWTAGFRGGACMEVGSWALWDSKIMRMISGTPPCDFRIEPGVNYIYRYDVRVVGSHLDIEAALYASRPLAAGEDGLMPILAYGRGTYELTMRHSRPLRLDEPAN